MNVPPDEVQGWLTVLDESPRILVLGCPGAGKTTVAKWLHEMTGRPLMHLDDEYWGPRWERPSDEHWRRSQIELARQPEWIIEGNYLPTIPIRARYATAVVVLDASSTACLWRVLHRTLRIKAGDYSQLPLAVRTQAQFGAVQATRDFLGLLRKIVGFRRRDFWVLMDHARSGAAIQIVVIVCDRLGIRRAALRRDLADMSWAQMVTVVGRLDPALRAKAEPKT